jgi:hypothetical protein
MQSGRKKSAGPRAKTIRLGTLEESVAFALRRAQNASFQRVRHPNNGRSRIIRLTAKSARKLEFLGRCAETMTPASMRSSVPPSPNMTDNRQTS